MFKDYYQILGLKKETFDPSQLPAAFRQKAKETHPDINSQRLGKKQSEEQFKDVNEANICLRDQEKRERYDRIYELRQQELKEGSTQRVSVPPTPASDNQYKQYRKEFNLDEILKKIIRESDEAMQRILRDSDEAMQRILRDSDESMKRIIGDLNQMTRDIQGSNPIMDTSSLDWLASQQSSATAEYQRKRHQPTTQAKKNFIQDKRLAIFNQDIILPESDIQVIKAMLKMIKDTELLSVTVNNQEGSPLWQISKSSSRNQRFIIKRSLIELKTDGKVIITTKDWNPMSIEKEISRHNLYDIGLIQEKGGLITAGLPKGTYAYACDLENIALGLAKPDGISPNVLGISRDKITTYTQNNLSIFNGVKRIKLKDIPDQVGKETLVEIKINPEGKPPVK